MKIILLYLSVFALVAKVYKSDENNYQTEEYSQENLLTDILVRELSHNLLPLTSYLLPK